MKVFFLPQTCALGPSSRYRVYQLLPLLRQAGIQDAVSPALDEDVYRQLYLSGSGSRLAALAAAWRRRRAALRGVEAFDVVFVQKAFFPGLYAGLECAMARHKPLVVDLDDAIWLPQEGGHPLLRALHREGPVQRILSAAVAVIAGNEFLAEYARRFNHRVTVVPSAIATAGYTQSRLEPVVGWIGSRTTLGYLNPLADVFRQLNVTPRVIAAGDPTRLGFPVEFRRWQLESELADLAAIGVGLAPLPDTPWERGKCGVKILQYMACGIPVIASPVGVQRELVCHGVNGFLAETPAQWRDYLQQLLSDAGLRQRFGAAGRELVTQHYDVTVAASRVAEVLKASTQT